MYSLGLDTSCYTTSLAAFDESGELILDWRRPLPVPAGERGLRQSEAVFHHVAALAEAADSLRELPGRPLAIAASVRPRPAGDAYLPVFRVAEAWGRALAASHGAAWVPVTHQDGHIAAGLWSAGFVSGDQPFLALHLSGGTTELLRVQQGNGPGAGPGVFGEEVLGRTRDLHAGQLIDRIGVALGLPFPAGPALDRLAAESGDSVEDARGQVVPSSVSDLNPSFSGPEAALFRLIQAGAPAGDVAVATLDCVRRTLEKAISRAVQTTGLRDVLMVGGVCANRYLRRHMFSAPRWERAPDRPRLWWPEPRYCTDNAVGVADCAMKAVRNI